jgi:hypothetical protein
MDTSLIIAATQESVWDPPACFLDNQATATTDSLSIPITRARSESNSNESQYSTNTTSSNSKRASVFVGGADSGVGGSANSPQRKMSINSVKSNSTINSSRTLNDLSAEADKDKEVNTRKAFDFSTLDDAFEKKSSVDGSSTTNRNLADNDEDDSEEDAQSGDADYVELSDTEAFKQINCDMSLTDVERILGDISLESFVKAKSYKERSKKNINYFINATSFNWQPDAIKVPLIYYVGFESANAAGSSYILDVDYSQLGINCLNRLLGFMGDRVSGSPPLAHADGLIRSVVNSSMPHIRDEVYCQICKQMNANPSAESVEKAWSLLMLCLASFPPSAELGPLLLKFLLNKYIINNNIDSSRGIGANFEEIKFPSINQLLATIDKSNRIIILSMKYLLESLRVNSCRREFLSSIEMESLWAGTSAKLKIHFIDDSFVYVDYKSWTTLDDLEKVITKKIGIKDSSVIAFGLFECSTISTTLTTSEDTWTYMDQSTRIGDIVCRWFQTQHKKSAYMTRPHPFKLVYKVRYYVDIPASDDVVASNLLVSQAMYDVSKLKYPIQEKDAYFLAALHFVAEYKDILMTTSRGRRESVQKVDVFKDKATLGVKRASDLTLIGEKYISPKFLEGNRPNTSEIVEKEILAIYESLCSMTHQMARKMFFDYVTSFKLYGTVLFVVEAQLAHHEQQKSTSNGKDKVDSRVGASSSVLFDSGTSEDTRLYYLAVANWALILIDIESGNVCKEFRYEDILTWGYKFNSLFLVTGSKSRPIKQYLKTGQSDLGKDIYDLIKIHVDFIKSKGK